MEPFLSLRHVSKTFHANRALNDISIDFMPGEVHCLAGQNGCGKSTLIKIISGVYRPDEGAAMTLGGKTWPKLTPAASVAHGIQVIYQRVGEHCYKPLSSRRAGEAQRTATQCGAGDAQY